MILAQNCDVSATFRRNLYDVNSAKLYDINSALNTFVPVCPIARGVDHPFATKLTTPNQGS